MAMMASQTGATVIGFNPKGFHASSGKTKILSDIVDDGIALVSVGSLPCSLGHRVGRHERRRGRRKRENAAKENSAYHSYGTAGG